ncbi:hypothetical protein [Streptomyces sp. RKCA744]|uniref:hypothetical protein n=1 Tax=Streptomyces sp. RKCA744 TaxID=2959340 RepID=UPI0020A10B30|nr:hypothetical protein [Streptomyces sp. RKCA744]MCO8308893.1 hypothetical protein [Streptomyces sp. RKCA744]
MIQAGNRGTQAEEQSDGSITEKSPATNDSVGDDVVSGNKQLPTGFGAVVKENEVGRDLNVGNNVNVTNYLTRLAHLKPHPIARRGIIKREVFEPPSGFEDALRALVLDPAGAAPFAGVLILVCEPGAGSRTGALRLLDACLPEDGRIFELFPDWEEPDVSLIPDEERTGYLLNLMGDKEPLSADFRDRLEEYAAKACTQGTRLIVLIDHHGWGSMASRQPRSPLVAMQLGRPSAAGVTERRLRSHFGAADRTAWLHDDGSEFRGLLSSATSPRAAVYLAEIIARAESSKDAQARDEYLGWKAQLTVWFGGSEKDAPEPRALRIATAFLDSCPARAVLDAADLLLAAPEVAWPAPVGGVLAGPDAKKRCTDADIAFRDDGTVSLADGHPGIDQALLRHVWHSRPQLVPVLTSWLGQISAPGGPAVPHLGQLARSLTVLAQSQGPTTVLSLVQDWLNKGNHKGLATQVLDDLAVHPRIGSAVRLSLRNWAKAPTMPSRQEAVAEVCGQRFGRDFTQVALNRLRDVLDCANNPGPRDGAMKTLRVLLASPQYMAQTLTALVNWTSEHSSQEPTGSGSAFVHLLTVPPTSDEGSKEEDPAPEPLLVHALLTREDEDGDAVRLLLRRGWSASWRHPGLRAQAAIALEGWCAGVESGALPQQPFAGVITAIFEVEANALSDDLSRIIGGHSPLRTRLRRQYAEAIHHAVAQGVPALHVPTQ